MLSIICIYIEGCGIVNYTIIMIWYELNLAKMTDLKNYAIRSIQQTLPYEHLDLKLSSFEEDLLNLLIGKQMYGLQISDAFEKISNGKRKISVSRLYPALNRLEQQGLITSRMAERPKDLKGGAKRKYFQITKKGTQVLNGVELYRQNLSQWQPLTI